MPSKLTKGKAEANVESSVKAYDPLVFARAAGRIHEEGARQYASEFLPTKAHVTKGVGGKAEGGTAEGVLAEAGAAQITRNTLEQLMDAKILSPKEALALGRILTLFEAGSVSTDEVKRVSLEVYEELVQSKASPVAIALAGIARNSVQIAVKMHTEGEVNWWRVVGADLAGAGTGALAGSAGGPLGTIGGAIAGAVVASGGELAKSK
ncbi:MAG TPA: hypothetical protein VF370_00375 [Candidatus Cryosericum sp.]